jgi:murein DD-endopeptidase MepM/ murein hydrolase activator NlpD
VDGYITRGFIDDKVMTSENHYGVDVAAAEGTPIKAAAAGVVVFSNWTYDLGYTVILYHSDGYFSIYGHNQRNSVVAHQYVKRGEVIGYLGNTGKSQGPHLHFEIWREGVPINPQELIYSYKKADISLKY